MRWSRLRSILSLGSDTRAVSEAISQGLIFMLVITAATGVVVASQDVIDTTRDEASFDQAVIGFEQLDEIAHSFATRGEQNSYLTASEVGTLYSRNAELVRTHPTTINISDGGESYQVDSQPIRIEHSLYDATYDTGLLQSDRIGNSTVHWIPTDQYAGSEDVLHLRTVHMGNSAFQGGSKQFVLVREHEPPEILSVSDSATITVETGQADAWRQYFESVGYLENVSTSPRGSQTEITAEFSASTTVYNQKVRIEPTDRFS